MLMYNLNWLPRNPNKDKNWKFPWHDPGGVRYPCVRNVLFGSGSISYVVWVGIVVHGGGNYKDGGGNPYNITKADYGEKGTEKNIWDVGNTGIWRCAEGSWNVYRSHIHQIQAEYSGSLDGFKTYI